jgi:hypothetical protein
MTGKGSQRPAWVWKLTPYVSPPSGVVRDGGAYYATLFHELVH